jgi:hypothetical protein
MKGKIHKMLLDTPDGDRAILIYDGTISPQMQKSLDNKENLKALPVFGYCPTDFGDLCFLFLALEAKENFKASNFQFLEFLFDPSCFSPGGIDDVVSIRTNSLVSSKKWLETLRKQDRLELMTSIRFTPILQGNNLTEYISFLDESILNWKPSNDYELASELLPREQTMEQIHERIRSENKITNNYAKLSMSFIASCCNFLSPNEQLRQWVESNKGENLAALLKDRLTEVETSGNWNSLSEISRNESENLIRDWLFTYRCINRAENSLMIAIGLTEGGNWAWRRMPQDRFDLIWDSARSYRSLLFDRHWQKIVKEDDIPTSRLDSYLLSGLKKIPERSVFNETEKILKQAIALKQYGITTGTTIVAGKQGFEWITFAQLDKESRCCIFKIVVDSKKGNMCLVGKLDAALGNIEFLGIKRTPENERSLNFLLFLAAIAYRDCIVARESLQSDNKQVKRGRTGKKGKVSRNQSQPPLLARLKTSSKRISTNFADPEDFLAQLKKRCPTFRTEHLRNLPDGWKASDRQKELAEEYRIFVPEGFTFVSPSGSEYISDPEDRIYRSMSLLKVFFENGIE